MEGTIWEQTVESEATALATCCSAEMVLKATFRGQSKGKPGGGETTRGAYLA